MHQPIVGIHFEARGLQRFQALRVALEDRPSLVRQQEVGEEIQPPRGGDVGLQHPHRSRGRVAWVGELRQFLLLALFVHAQKRLQRHQ